VAIFALLTAAVIGIEWIALHSQLHGVALLGGAATMGLLIRLGGGEGSLAGPTGGAGRGLGALALALLLAAGLRIVGGGLRPEVPLRWYFDTALAAAEPDCWSVVGTAEQAARMPRGSRALAARALAAVEACVGQHPDQPTFHQALGVIHQLAGRTRESAKAVHRALDLALPLPDHRELAATLAARLAFLTREGPLVPEGVAPPGVALSGSRVRVEGEGYAGWTLELLAVDRSGGRRVVQAVVAEDGLLLPGAGAARGLRLLAATPSHADPPDHGPRVVRLPPTPPPQVGDGPVS